MINAEVEQKDTEKLERFSITAPAELKDRADKLAKQYNLSMSALVRLALMRAIENPGSLMGNEQSHTQAYAA